MDGEFETDLDDEGEIFPVAVSTPAPRRPVVELTEEQQELSAEIDSFIADPFRGDVFHYDGLAGTGKTVILAQVAQRNANCQMCALSGKAASILRAKTGLPANTIHSLFYKLIRSRDLENGKQIMEWRSVFGGGILRDQIILIDEKSMVSREIRRDILNTGARIVAAGDPGQLKPVNGTQGFEDPNFTLRHIHRQALDSAIIRQAYRVRSGQPYVNDGPDFQVVDSLPKDALAAADMVLVWKNTTRVEITRIIRKIRGFAGQLPQPGEPVMCLRNCPDYGLYNGVTYTLLEPFENGHNIIHIEMDGEKLSVPLVYFEGIPNAVPAGAKAQTHFTFAYAMTVHKAQGSEADSVVLIDEYSMPEDRESWIYTGITRAAKRITVMRW